MEMAFIESPEVFVDRLVADPLVPRLVAEGLTDLFGRPVTLQTLTDDFVDLRPVDLVVPGEFATPVVASCRPRFRDERKKIALAPFHGVRRPASLVHQVPDRRGLV